MSWSPAKAMRVCGCSIGGAAEGGRCAQAPPAETADRRVPASAGGHHCRRGRARGLRRAGRDAAHPGRRDSALRDAGGIGRRCRAGRRSLHLSAPGTALAGGERTAAAAGAAVLRGRGGRAPRRSRGVSEGDPAAVRPRGAGHGDAQRGPRRGSGGRGRRPGAVRALLRRAAGRPPRARRHPHALPARPALPELHGDASGGARRAARAVLGRAAPQVLARLRLVGPVGEPPHHAARPAGDAQRPAGVRRRRSRGVRLRPPADPAPAALRAPGDGLPRRVGAAGRPPDRGRRGRGEGHRPDVGAAHAHAPARPAGHGLHGAHLPGAARRAGPRRAAPRRVRLDAGAGARGRGHLRAR